MYYRENINEDETNKDIDKSMGYPYYWQPGMPTPIQDYQLMPFQYQNLYLYGVPGHYGSAHIYESPFHYENPYTNGNKRVGVVNYNCMWMCPFIYFGKILREYW